MSFNVFAKPKKFLRHPARAKLWFVALFMLLGLTSSLATVTTALTDADVTILSPDNGAILDGVVTLQVNVAGPAPTSVVFYYDPHEDTDPEVVIGPAAFNSTTGFWELAWDTTTVPDTYNIIDTDGNGIEDTTVNITKPPTHDRLRVVATAADLTTGQAGIDIRIQNMLTVRFTLPDNQEDLRGFNDLEAILTSQHSITSVNFDVYDMADADPDILTPFGEFESLGEPIENRHYGRPLGSPAFPTGSPLYPIGAAAPEGSNTKRWVIRGWDTTTIPDGTYLIVATATDSGGRTATYMVESYIVNDLRVVITAPDDGDEVSRFVPLEARTSSLTGADNAAPGSLWPATAVEFDIDGTILPATEIPAGSGRWRAVWDGDSFAPGPYTITATATNANPGGAEIATDSIGVTLVAAGGDLEAFFPFDWSYCHLYQCSFLDGSGGGPNWWLWDFGDGNTSTAQNPIHSYVTHGVYEVSLTVSNDGGATQETYTRLIPVGNTGVVSFNRNDLDIESATEFIDWTSAFKNFDYTVGSTLAIPVMWETTVGNAQFNSMATTVCDDDEDTGNQECVIFTPEEADGNPPHGIVAAESGVLFLIEFTEVQYRGITDIFKGKVNVRIVVDVDTDGNGSFDQENQLGTNVDVTNDGLPDPVLVAITSPLEGAQVAGIVPIEAATVSSVTADQIEFFVGNTSIGVDNDGAPWTVNWDTTLGSDGAHQLSVVATGPGFAATSNVVNVVVANTPPTAVISAPISCTDLTCSFDGSGSSATNGIVEDYTWTFLDGATLLGTRNGVTASFTFPGSGPYTARLTVTDSVGATGSAETTTFTPTPNATTFQIGFASDEVNQYLTFPYELCIPEEGEEDCVPGGPPPFTPLDASMEADFSNIVVIPGGGVIGGDLIEFDVTITNTSPPGSGIVLSAYAFQSKVSESPALASRVGDKAFYSQVVPGSLVTTADSPLVAVKKNGTSNGLFTGKWKGICINSSVDFIPEFNSGLEDETLECAGNRADTNADGEPELQTGANMLGLRPGESQTIRIMVDAGTTDGAMHVVAPNTLTGVVTATEVLGPNGLTYYVPTMETPGNVLSIPDFGDNKVLRDADGTFNPTFAPAADGYTFDNQIYLTLPRRNFAFTDIIGRNHTCGTYGLDGVTGGACDGTPGASPLIHFLDTGDLVPGVQNFAAILRGYGEFYDANGDFIPDINPDTGDVQPSYPYGVRCDNCGGLPYVPIAEFYYDNGDGTVTRQIVGGTYGDPVADPYLTLIDSLTAEHVKQEVIPEPDPGGPCQGGERKPACAKLGTSAVGEFYDLTVVPGGGTNGGDAIEFTIDITNSSTNPEAFLTAFNYQTKSRGLADIGILDGFTQDRRDIRVANLTVPGYLPNCGSLNDGACWNPALQVGHFPNVIGNGLLFGQMVWQSSNDAGREGPVIPDQVYVDPVNGFDPVHYQLESVKKNGPFSPILKGNVNFICIKSGLFDNDPDADAGCAGEPAILIDPNGEPVPSNILNEGPFGGRLGLPPGATQSVRIRMEFGDFRGAMLEIVAGTLNAGTVHDDFVGTMGLGRDFDCSDQRELEFCHPYNNGTVIGYLPNTDAEWMTPANLEDIEYVIINQPGDAPTVMNFQQNFGVILAMAGFIPSAEFYAPDPNEDLIGTPYEGILIRQQVLGDYSLTEPPTMAPLIMSEPETSGETSSAFTYQVTATGYPVPTFSLLQAPSGMTINSSTGLISWGSPAPGTHDVEVKAQNSVGSDTQIFQVEILDTSPTATPEPTEEPPTATPEPTEEPPTATPEPTEEPPTATPEPPTATPEPTEEPPTATPEPTEEPPTATPEPTEEPPTATPEPTATAPAPQQGLVFSTNPNRSNPAGLGGATVSGDIYVYISPNTNIKEVKFWIDNPSGKPYSTDTSAPFDLMGGSTSKAKPLHTTGMANGSHTIYVEVRFKNGTKTLVQATFTVDNPDPGLVFSTNPNRGNPVELGDAVVSGDIHVFINPDSRVKEVKFWIDNPSGKPYSTDTSAPFDLMGGSASKAKPLHTMGLTNGAHTIYVEVTFKDKSKTLMQATFTVDNPSMADFLVYSTSSNRSNPAQLEGVVLSGNVYVYLNFTHNVKAVKFQVDKSSSVTDKSAPFDLVGGSASSAKPWATTQQLNGAHTVKVQVEFKNGAKQEFTTSFTIDNPLPANVLVYSTNSNRSNPLMLDGATLSKNQGIHVYVNPPTGVKQVQFWIDKYSGNPYSTDKSAPFDLVGGDNKKAKTWSLKKLSTGPHTVYALLTFNNGSTQLIHATFNAQK